MFSIDFRKSSITKFHKNLFRGKSGVTCGQRDNQSGRTDRHDEDNNRSSEFCKRTQKVGYWKNVYEIPEYA